MLSLSPSRPEGTKLSLNEKCLVVIEFHLVKALITFDLDDVFDILKTF